MRAASLTTALLRTTDTSTRFTVYEAIIGFQDYSKWNRFVQNVKAVNGSLQHPVVNMEMSFDSAGLLGPFNATSKEIITYLQPGKDYAVAAWKFDDSLSGYFQEAEHPNILTATEDGTATRYVSYESYYGLGALPTALLVGNLRKQFAVQADDLKAYVESQI